MFASLRRLQGAASAWGLHLGKEGHLLKRQGGTMIVRVALTGGSALPPISVSRGDGDRISGSVKTKASLSCIWKTIQSLEVLGGLGISGESFRI